MDIHSYDFMSWEIPLLAICNAQDHQGPVGQCHSPDTGQEQISREYLISGHICDNPTSAPNSCPVI